MKRWRLRTFWASSWDATDAKEGVVALLIFGPAWFGFVAGRSQSGAGAYVTIFAGWRALDLYLDLDGRTS